VSKFRYQLWVCRSGLAFDTLFVLAALLVHSFGYVQGWIEGGEVPQTSALVLIFIALLYFGDRNARKQWREAGQFYLSSDVEELLTSGNPDAREYGLVLSGHKTDTFMEYVPWFIRDRWFKEHSRHLNEFDNDL